MKKRWICLLSLCLLCVYLFPITAHGDVIVGLDDSFWTKNEDLCDYFYRAYTVNGAEGYGILWESPISSRQREVVANGATVSGDWHYTDDNGETWLAVSEAGPGLSDTVRGWIKTSECLPVPDYISFREEYGEEFVGYDTSYDHAFDGLDQVALWKYPCSGESDPSMVDADWFQQIEDLGKTLSTCWRDPQGRLWSFVGYCYGIRNTWVCLDDPANVQPGTASLEAGESLLPQDATVYPPAETLPSPDGGVTLLTIVAVLAVVAVTAVLLWILFLKKRNHSSPGQTQ